MNRTKIQYTPTLVGVNEKGTQTLKNVIAISAGTFHSLALKEDGTVWAWGMNYGVLGGMVNGLNSPSPIQVVGVNGRGLLSNVVAISAGTMHSLALKRNGVLLAWGWECRWTPW